MKDKRMTFDSSGEFYARKSFRFAGRSYAPGDSFPWGRLSCSARKLAQLVDNGFLTRQAPEPREDELTAEQKAEIEKAAAEKKAKAEKVAEEKRAKAAAKEAKKAEAEAAKASRKAEVESKKADEPSSPPDAGEGNGDQ